ncbi:MAG: hypothetical protein WGN25_18790 [Candidatus Electrothrix sp. GW3-4]|uniref:hypothetical protein n=1 Tax=Candidatus Electrothrix sp. GW3-4 TaxID=3126740 RepID=UPI0030D52301
MSKASQIIILCEDRAHEIFVTRFLKKGWGVKPRTIRVVPYPGGKGSGKKFVLEKFSEEAKACRSRHAATILLVIQDADEFSVEQVRTELAAKLLPPRDEAEPIAYIIPKWHIETWIAYLAGELINEEEKNIYKNKYGALSERKDAHPFIDSLADTCRKNIELESPPDSLVAACEEFTRIRHLL